MVKKVIKEKSESFKTITTPSFFGSHKSMVVKNLENGKCLCKDDSGEYITEIKRLDNGLADPNRCSGRL